MTVGLEIRQAERRLSRLDSDVKLDRAGSNWIGSDSGINTRYAVVPVLVLLCLNACSPLNRLFRFVRRGLFGFRVMNRVGVGVRLLALN